METFVKKGAINCVHMLLLLKAEMMPRTCKKVSSGSAERAKQDIRQAFDNAINSANRSGFCQNAGLANERAASYYSEIDVEYANDYWKSALEHYRYYGATRKLQQISELQAHLDLQKNVRTSQRNGRMNSRSCYEEEGAEQHRSMDFW
jgi:hypothetical protein